MAQIGIFWVYGGSLLGRAVALSAGAENVPGILDSRDNHVDLWEKNPDFLKRYPDLRDQDYYMIPRGRVLWQRAQGRAIVYMDKKLFDDATKAKIMVFFELEAGCVDWHTDLHYTTDRGALAELFDEEGF